VSDSGGSFLDRVEVWRADHDLSTCPTGQDAACNWDEVLPLRRTFTGLDWNYSIENAADNPAAGEYWYGIHVVDRANNCVTEENKDCDPPHAQKPGGTHGPDKITVPISGNAHYVTQNGAGTRDGSTLANAWSVAQFNSSGIWNSLPEPDDRFIGPGDIVYFSGTITTWIDVPGSGTCSNKITLDGWKDGTCTPISQTCTNSADFSGAGIEIEQDNIVITDFRFSQQALSISTGVNGKVIGNKISNCFFDMPYSWVSIRLGFICDSVIDGNYFYDSYRTGAPDDRRGFSFGAGSRNRIINNYIDGGKVGIGILFQYKWQQNDGVTWVDISGDVDANIQDNEIAYNTIAYRYEEGLSHDPFDSPTGYPVVEWDYVSAVSSNIVTLSHANWSGTSNKWINFYMIAVSDRNDAFGNHTLITAQSGAQFTLASAISNLQVGDVVAISLLSRHNWIHHNTVDYDDWPTSAIVIEGPAIENLVEYNNILPVGSTCNPAGYPNLLYNHGIAGDWNNPDSVTGTYGCNVNAYNIIRNNTAENVSDVVWYRDYGSPHYHFLARNNAVYNNTTGCGVWLQNAATYVNNNTPTYSDVYTYGVNAIPAKDVRACNNCSTRDDDPTGSVSSYFASWPNFETCGGSLICTSFTYSAWTPAVCPPNGIQTRTVISSQPPGCTGGNPVLSQSCTYMPSDTIFPTVNSLDLSLGSVIIDWNVSDAGGSYLDRIEVWRADYDSSACPTGSEAACGWNEVYSLRRTFTGLDWTYSDEIATDYPDPGEYWYGIHAVDRANNCVTEENKDCNPPFAQKPGGTHGPDRITVPISGNAHYVTQNGAGARNGDSLANAWSAILTG